MVNEYFRGGTMNNVNGIMDNFDGNMNKAGGTMYNAYNTMCRNLEECWWNRAYDLVSNKYMSRGGGILINAYGTLNKVSVDETMKIFGVILHICWLNLQNK